MPTLTRVFVGLVILAGLSGAAVWSLATFVEPHPREMVIKVPQERLEAK
ncbi:histidine kinase [Pinisolibacter aquiterrae]|nr:histidine kinase [Pinisolibacter aquiterrae]MBV5262772.1 histidine kinase [Pinisolibacter aquiterrae]MCC8233592.1 histidine kinase [Pinisolibacter aquiterrae]